MKAEPERLTAAVECRASEDGPMLRGVILQEGRAASGGRAEVFAPGSAVWPSDGIGILLEHLAPPVARAVPERSDHGEIRIAVPASPAILQAVEQEGRRYMSVEFRAEDDHQTPGGVREIRRAMIIAAALTATPEYDTTSAEVRSRRTEPRVWL